MIRVGIIGAAGYVGGELVRLLSGHPEAQITYVTSDRLAGSPLCESFPALYGSTAGNILLEEYEAEKAAVRCDAVFVALPHTRSMNVVAELHAAGLVVIDMSADYRLSEPQLYKDTYGENHNYPELLGEAVYGLPELKRAELSGAKLIASPGCYPTASLLALLPLSKAGVLDGSAPIIIDAKSGVSGAGRVPGEGNIYGQVNENFTAYKVGTHRHAPEIELYLGAPLLFVPHLVPMDRGILATAYVDGGKEVLPRLRGIYEEYYSGEEFVTVLPEGVSPQTKAVRGSNNCHIGLFSHEPTGKIIVVSAIDNLIKGAAGQGIQAFNVSAGLPESAGLTALPLAN